MAENVSERRLRYCAGASSVLLLALSAPLIDHAGAHAHYYALSNPRYVFILTLHFSVLILGAVVASRAWAAPSNP